MIEDLPLATQGPTVRTVAVNNKLYFQAIVHITQDNQIFSPLFEIFDALEEWQRRNFGE